MGKGKETKRVVGSTASPLNGLTFAAFANHSSNAASAVSLASSKTSKGNRTAPSLKPTPIYSGQDTKLLQIFKRIGQKRDAVTKSRALVELSSYAYSEGSILPKSEKVAALAHLFFLFGTKLITDNHASVRAEALSCLASALSHAPKAARTLLMGNAHEGENEAMLTFQTVGNVIGWVYTSQGEPSSEVSKCAKRAWEEIVVLYSPTKVKSQDDRTYNIDMKKGGESNCIWKRVIVHIESILLSSSRPSYLQDSLSVIYKGDSNENRSLEKVKGKKGKKTSNLGGATGMDSKSNAMSDVEREEMEERHDRIVRSTLNGFRLLVENYAEIDFVYIHVFGKESVLWKHISSTKGGFRRATYTLVGSLCQYAPSLIHPRYYAKNGTEKGNDNLSSLILNALSSERDPANIPLLFEMILLFFASFKKGSNSDNSQWNTSSENDIGLCRGMDLEAFTKAIGKVIKRGCYGSSSKYWCNSMLPMLASLPFSDGQIQTSFLSNLVSE